MARCASYASKWSLLSVVGLAALIASCAREPEPETGQGDTPQESHAQHEIEPTETANQNVSEPTPPETPSPETPPPETPPPETPPLETPVAQGESTDTGNGIRRQWTVRDEEPIFVVAESLADDHIVLQIDGGVRRIEAKDLAVEDQWFLKHWSDPSKRRALRKYAEIGSVSCDKDGGIALGLSQSGCTDNDLSLVASLPEVTHINLFESPVSDEGLRILAGLKNLRGLYLQETDVKGPGFQYLAELTNLEEFQYSPDPGPGHAAEFGQYLVHFKNLKNLKELEFWFCVFDEGAWEPIGELTSLEKLSLFGSQFPAGEVKHLKNLTRMRELDLGDGSFGDADMVYLAGMTELRVLNVAAASMTKSGMEHIGKLVNLEKVDLPRSLHDADLAPLKTLTKLKSLSLRGENLTDGCLAHLSEMHDMEALSLPERVTAKGLKHLAGMKKLKQLTFAGENVTMSEAMHLVVDQQGRSVIEALQIILRPDIVNEEGKLTWITLDYRPVADLPMLKYLKQLPDLTGMAIGKEATDEWLAEIGPLTQLESLQFRGSRFHDKPLRFSKAGLQHLSGLEALSELSFSQCELGQDAFAPLAGLPQLESLRLSDCEFANGNIEAIGRIKSLKSLSMFSVNVADDDLRFLTGLDNLESLTVPETVSVTGLAHLQSLKNLTRIDMDWSKTSFADIFNLLTNSFGKTKSEALNLFLYGKQSETGEILALNLPTELPTDDDDLLVVVEVAPEIEDLRLPSSITDAGLAHVGQLTKLRSLGLNGQNITDTGLAHLKNLQQLERISIQSQKVTDAGLVHLANLKSLKAVNMYGPQVTDEGVERLQQALPDASIRK